MKEDEVGETYSTHGRYDKYIQNISRETGKEETTLMQMRNSVR
jgi:hypothetical protein